MRARATSAVDAVATKDKSAGPPTVTGEISKSQTLKRQTALPNGVRRRQDGDVMDSLILQETSVSGSESVSESKGITSASGMRIPMCLGRPITVGYWANPNDTDPDTNCSRQ